MHEYGAACPWNDYGTCVTVPCCETGSFCSGCVICCGGVWTGYVCFLCYGIECGVSYEILYAVLGCGIWIASGCDPGDDPWMGRWCLSYFQTWVSPNPPCKSPLGDFA